MSAGGAGGSMTPSTSSANSAGGGAATSTSSSSAGGGGAGGSGACTPGATQACYSGPPNTMNLGACKAGAQTCQDDGTFGPRVGEVLPVPESCTTTIDDNCNGKTNEGCICTPGTTQPCYGGPPGTEERRHLQGGHEDLRRRRPRLRPVSGELQPVQENCLSPTTRIATGPRRRHRQRPLAKRFGDAQAQVANAVADRVGGLVITGALRARPTSAGAC